MCQIAQKSESAYIQELTCNTSTLRNRIAIVRDDSKSKDAENTASFRAIGLWSGELGSAITPAGDSAHCCLVTLNSKIPS